MYAQHQPFTYTYLDIIIWRIQLQEEKLLSLGAALKVLQSAAGEPREIGIQSMLNNAHPRGTTCCYLSLQNKGHIGTSYILPEVILF